MIGAALDLLRHVRRRRAWSAQQAAGRRGEDLAHRFLRRNGFVIVARNYRLPTGEAEVDLIAWERDTLVFIEVKSRESGAYGPPDRAITPEKRRHMLRAAREYVRKREIPLDRVRFDVVTVLLTDLPSINLFRGRLNTA
jgi:putative endonuclease